MQESHQGGHGENPFATESDPRLAQYGALFRRFSPLDQANHQLAQDIHLTAQAQISKRNRLGVILEGMILQAIASHHWYRVQTGAGNGIVAACWAADGSLLPVGVGPIGALPPGSRVILYQPVGLEYAIILGVLPVKPLGRLGNLFLPDWLVQGGQSGGAREAAHRYPIDFLDHQGGVLDFSSGRPIDGTPFERGFMSETGVGLLIDSFQAYLRVNEQCGLFLSLFDGHTRLAGQQLDISSLVHEVQALDDEQESRYFEGQAVYPWEALGLYRPASTWTAKFDDTEVQQRIARGSIDLPAGFEDTQPIYRYKEYGGYLGQGHMRLVSCPPPLTQGVRRARDTAVDEGLFCEAIGLDGSYALRSAKSVYIGKRCKIVVPWELRRPDDPQGDDARAGNYRFSSETGGGEAHQISDLKVSGTQRSQRRLAGVSDWIAHAVNWKALHPFHYHQGDFRTPQESEQNAHFQRVQETPNFSELADRAYLSDPVPKLVKIDHRYNSVAFYERESFLVFHDDGSVQMGCGFGAELSFGGGGVRISAPGDIQLLPGRDLIGMAGNVILRAHRSVDVSAAQNDVRIKAERNCQVLAGNSGEGALLLESKGRGTTQLYQERIGEAVAGSGVVVRASGSSCTFLGRDLYLRSGEGGETEGGDILLDANKGANRVQIYGKEFNTFTSKAVNFFYGPHDEDSTVRKSYHFGEKTLLIGATTVIDGQIFGVGRSGLFLEGGIFAEKSIVSSLGHMVSKNGGPLGKVPDGFADTLQDVFNAVTDTIDVFDKAGQETHQVTVVEKFYNANRLGNTDVLKFLHFSYRDDDKEEQYGVQGFVFPEPRWQQMIRQASGITGRTWQEPPVAYQGRDLYPWPGRKKWVEEQVFLRPGASSLYDPVTGVSRDRPTPYLDAALSNWEPSTMADGFRIIR